MQCVAADAHRHPLLVQLSYAIGSLIPLHITLTSPDQQVLDLLSTPSAIKIQLFRERLVGSIALKDGPQGRSDNTFRESCGSAFFWPAEEGSPVDGKKVLQGELIVGRSLKPSFAFPRFALKVRTVCVGDFYVP